MFLTAKDGKDLPEEKVKVWLLQKWTKIPMRYLFTTVQYYLDKDEWKIDYNELDGISWLHLSCLMFAVSGQAERYLYSLILPPPATRLPHFFNLQIYSNICIKLKTKIIKRIKYSSHTDQSYTLSLHHKISYVLNDFLCLHFELCLYYFLSSRNITIRDPAKSIMIITLFSIHWRHL